MFNGQAYTVEKRNISRKELFTVSEGTHLLYSEIVDKIVEGEPSEEFLMVWLAIPFTAHVPEEEGTRPLTIPPGESAQSWEDAADLDDGITVEVFEDE